MTDWILHGKPLLESCDFSRPPHNPARISSSPFLPCPSVCRTRVFPSATCPSIGPSVHPPASPSHVSGQVKDRARTRARFNDPLSPLPTYCGCIGRTRTETGQPDYWRARSPYSWLHRRAVRPQSRRREKVHFPHSSSLSLPCSLSRPPARSPPSAALFSSTTTNKSHLTELAEGRKEGRKEGSRLLACGSLLRAVTLFGRRTKLEARSRQTDCTDMTTDTADVGSAATASEASATSSPLPSGSPPSAPAAGTMALGGDREAPRSGSGTASALASGSPSPPVAQTTPASGMSFSAFKIVAPRPPNSSASHEGKSRTQFK